jgi:hypothetical protein
MLTGGKMSGEIRSEQRTAVKFNALCDCNGTVTACDILDISPQGAGIRINSLLVAGDMVSIILGEQCLPAKVIRANGNMAGLWFQDLSADQTSYIKWLCRKGLEGNPPRQENNMVDFGTKVYELKAGSEKDRGLMGLFLSSLKKNCKGFIAADPMANGSFQIVISGSPSSVSSFESLLMFWKAGSLIVK